MGGKTRNEQKESSTQTNAPPSWAASGMEAIAGKINSILPGLQTPQYNGNFLAQPNAGELAIPGLYRDAANMAGSLVDPAMAAMQRNQQLPGFSTNLGAGTGSFAGYDATGIQPVVNAAIQPLMRQLTEQILPSLSSSAIESGAYGGTRAMETLPGMAIRDVGRQAAEVGTGIAYQDFLDQQNRSLQAYGLDTQRGLGEADVLTSRLQQFPDLLDTIMRMQTGKADLAATAGGMERGFEQTAIDNALMQRDNQVRQPFQGLDVATELLARLAGNYGTSSRTGTTTNTQTSGGLGNIVGGAMGLASLIGGFPGAGGAISGLFSRQPAAAAPLARADVSRYMGW